MPPALVNRLAKWLAGAGRFEMRKASSTATALKAAAQVIAPILDASLMATVIQRAQQLGPLPKGTHVADLVRKQHYFHMSTGASILGPGRTLG